MVVHARSDLAYIFVSQAHRGCGQPHRRPVEHGAPAKIWSLSCEGGCEDFLRSDSNWSTTLAELPETYDEKLAREDFDKRGARDRDQILALALAKLANVELPETLLRPLTGNMPHIPEAAKVLVDCPQGHPNVPGSKFCNECGSPFTEPPAPQNGTPAAPVATEPAPPAEAVSGAPEPPSAPLAFLLPSNTKMRGMGKDDLAKLARKAGVDASGTRAELLERLIAANNGKGANAQ